ncbi:MAG TPA: ATP-binding protein [Bryobacteraceae bacterium]|nr:ATP-binding protein [Bryobacteraceae bacterium]
MIFQSIRWRLQLWHGLLLLVVLTGFGITAWRVARDSYWRQTDAELQETLDRLLRPPVPGRPHPFPPLLEPPPPPGEISEQALNGFRAMLMLNMRSSNVKNGYLVLWRADGSVAAQTGSTPREVPRPRDSIRQASATGRARGEYREFYRFLPFGDVLLVGRSVAPELAALDTVKLWLLAAGVTIWLLGLAGGWWLTTRALHTVDVISETAEKIAAGDLSRRIEVANTDSELDRLANVLNATFARLEHAFEQQAQFTADASHELRTPIAVVLTQTQSALARERSAAEYREALEACARAAQRMRKLVESLLQLARLDAEEEPARREPVDLSFVAGECLEFVRPMAELRGISIDADLQRAQCFGDPEQLSQVATNLLANAVQFNREAGVIHVSTFAENGTAQLIVSDTGNGIPPEDLRRVFDRFYRVDKSRSRASGRSGLGLAICKSIVEAHSGTIVAASSDGAGATFTVSLPALQEGGKRVHTSGGTHTLGSGV